MLDPAHVLTQLGGLARGAHLQHFGISRNTLSRHVRAGRIQRVRAGIFATHFVDPAVLQAAAHGGALTCASVLRARGVWVLDQTPELHVWLGPKGRVHPHPDCRCRSHFYTGAPPLGSTDIETALVHLHRCSGDEAFFAAFESAWRQRLVSALARARVRTALPANARWLVDFARADADSGLESLLRLRLHLLGIRLECQVVIRGVGRVDFVIGGRLILEADGRENHDSQSNRHKDRVRDAAASALGFETLRFDYAQVIHDWPAVQAAILAALTRLPS